MFVLSSISENSVHINPILRFIIYFVFSVPLTVCALTFVIKFLTFFLLPLKICFWISVFFGIIMTIFLAVMCIVIPYT